MLLMIDNYDSFTFNLVQYLRELHNHVVVYRNDKISIADIIRLKPTSIVISPGPGCPDEAGITLDVIKNFSDKIPILGVCLGHQALAQAFGAKIIKASKVMHGKTSLIHHHSKGIFQNIPMPFQATRYHSLIIDKNTLPEEFMITAKTSVDDGDEIMGIQHRSRPLHGVQFHPESILSEHGHQLLANFLSEIVS